jgi:hypothetical protein
MRASWPVVDETYKNNPVIAFVGAPLANRGRLATLAPAQTAGAVPV